MEPKTINSTVLRTKTRDLMERVKYNREIFLVETFGRPMAVLISLQDFELIQKILKQAGVENTHREGVSESSDKSMKRKKGTYAKTRESG